MSATVRYYFLIQFCINPNHACLDTDWLAYQPQRYPSMDVCEREIVWLPVPPDQTEWKCLSGEANARELSWPVVLPPTKRW